jgi:hypothetical protein
LKYEELETEDKTVLQSLSDLVVRVVEGSKAVKDLRAALDKKTREQFYQIDRR